MRQLVDKRIGARRTDPWDEPTAPVMTDRNAWDDYNKELEEEFDEYRGRSFLLSIQGPYKAAELSVAQPGGEQIARWPTRFPISTVHRRYDPEDNQPYTYDEFLRHYADTQVWSQQSVWNFWQGLTPAPDHILI